MLHAVRGSLVTEYFAEHLLAGRFAHRLGEDDREASRRVFTRIVRACRSLGPASSLRAVFDAGAAPLSQLLGFNVAELRVAPGESRLAGVLEGGRARVALMVTAWGDNLETAWRDSILFAVASGTRWCLLFNGRQIRLVDSSRSYGREHLELDMEGACDDRASFDLLWGLLRASAFESNGPRSPLLEEAVELSARHGVGVCRSLQHGVLEALSALMQALVSARPASFAIGRAHDGQLSSLFEQSLTIVYRVLFLLFAEARRLLPTWHPIYRTGYSVETLRAAAEDPRPETVVGLWETLRAISRLAHHGCRAGSLVVTPFNGRLFSPARTPFAESARLDDRAAKRAIVALSTQDAGAGRARARIVYRDLGVEQLGAVYEGVLDYQPVIEGPGLKPGTYDRHPGNGRFRASARDIQVRLEKGGGRRKATGSFYTPQALTGYLVRRTLQPLVEAASAERILQLRILDPAMGSGAFLVAACRHLASCYERALIAEGQRQAGDIDEGDRAMFRRLVAQRCLFGVDLNPMAVQLARLSLWLATLAADRPLTFLDHHLGVGDSLVGASPTDVLRYPGHRATHASTERHPLLFDAQDLQADLDRVLPERLRMALQPDDSLAAVKEKERVIERLARADGPLARWKDAANLWCACWFSRDGDRPSRGVYHDLVESLIGGRASLPAASCRPLLDRARAIASSRRFFHWQMEFPEVFFGDGGALPGAAGFDAVIGNPPWDMLRADQPACDDEKVYDRALAHFGRHSQLYHSQGDGHANRFQLFVERALQLVRAGGRIGLVVPWGLFADHGCRHLRHRLFDGADTDTVIAFDNSRAIFPIHRSVRFALVTTTAGRPTARTACRFGENDISVLDTLPDGPGHATLILSPSLLVRLSGNDLSVPDLRSRIDLEILEHAASSFPVLSSEDGWRAHFGRELNASDDRGHFAQGGEGLPVLEGKHVEPFVANAGRATLRIPAEVAARLLGGDRSFRHQRLAYRDVASATNRTTLIAAILPADCVTTHTLFCLKTRIELEAQWFLCGVMNSYAANYFVRMRVTTHVTTGIIGRLPVPFVDVHSGTGAAIATSARRLAAAAPGTTDDRLQALVARMYELTPAQFEHVLSTFPLVKEERRRAAYEEFVKGRSTIPERQSAGCR